MSISIESLKVAVGTENIPLIQQEERGHKILYLYLNSFRWCLESEIEDLKIFYGQIFFELIENYDKYFENFFSDYTPLPPKKLKTPEAKNIWIYLDKLEKLKLISGKDVEPNRKKGELILSAFKWAGNDDKTKKFRERNPSYKCPIFYIIKPIIYREFPSFYDEGICNFNYEKNRYETIFKDSKSRDKSRFNRKSLFPNNDNSYFDEIFVDDLEIYQTDKNFKPIFCENFYEKRKLIRKCKHVKEGQCPLFLLINEDQREIIRLEKCRTNNELFEIF